MPDSHALLSASSAHRWLNCPPSAKAVEGTADAPSDAALQGTAAHALAEHKLLRALKRRSKRPTSEWIDDEMDALTSDYVDFVLERLAEVRQTCPDAQVFVEQRLDYSHVAPGGFGTGDCVIVAEPTLHVIDLKYGMGVQVSAVDNPQLKLYGLGALAAFGALYDITEVQLSIFQPRRANVETWTISTADLITWGQETVAPIAAIAAAGGGEYKAGAWCQFCRIAPTCRARADANLALARHEFAPPAELTLDEVAGVLTRIPELKAWASNVEAWALAQAQAGTQVPGFKVVAGRSVRKYSDEAAVAEAAKQAGYTDIWDKKLIGITAMEKLMGRSTFKDVLGDLVVKPEGRPTLVPESDKRPALQRVSAATDFTNTNHN
jgi:phage-associated protein (fragment)